MRPLRRLVGRLVVPPNPVALCAPTQHHILPALPVCTAARVVGAAGLATSAHPQGGPGPRPSNNAPASLPRVITAVITELVSSLEGWSIEDVSLVLTVLARLRAQEAGSIDGHLGVLQYGECNIN